MSPASAAAVVLCVQGLCNQLHACLMHVHTLSVRMSMSPLDPLMSSGVTLPLHTRDLSVSTASIMLTTRGLRLRDSPPFCSSLSSLPDSRLVNMAAACW